MKQAVLQFVSDLVTLCGHERESWPMRLPGEAVAHRTCLECGRRRPYPLLEARNRVAVEAPPAADYVACTS